MDAGDPFKEDSLFKENLYAQGKSRYVLGAKPDVGCILCAVRDDDPRVVIKKLHQDEACFVILNLYPFNPGHLMIVPSRHVERWRDLAPAEVAGVTSLVGEFQGILERALGATSFNVGLNEGPCSGASIDHLHVHVVPRFRNEIGFIDNIGKTRALIFTIDEVHEKLLAAARPRDGNGNPSRGT